MTEKTIRGKKCPHCSSFVKDGLKKCPVCGSGLKPKSTRTRAESDGEGFSEPKTLDMGDRAGVIICDKCGTENAPDFRFCKICKHPLKGHTVPEPYETSGTAPQKTAKIKLKLEWKLIPPGYETLDRIELKEFLPYFSGVGEWLGYAFFVFRTSDVLKIMVRKTDPKTDPSFFRKREGAFMLESGRDFFLGAMRFNLLGDLDEQADSGTVMRSEKTVLKGPGERDILSEKKGVPRIKTADVKTSSAESEIREKILLGRDWLVENLGCDPEDLRKNGVSQEHARLSPMSGGCWLLEPVNKKPVFETIEKIPVLLNDGDCLRFLSLKGPGEFSLHLKSGGE
jgi:hypothetical protein